MAFTTFNDERFPVIRRLNLSAQAQIGEEVVATGFPDGGKQEYSVTAHVLGFGPDNATVKVDWAFIQGMSGGPVLNSRHKLIGIVQKCSSKDVYPRDGEFIPLSLVAELVPFNTWPNTLKADC